jgi:Na(+)/H(+) antiporter
MAWDHLAITKPHLVYIILGGFTSLFMLCSSVIKERLYIGEATVATLCGIIFGPHAADLIDPSSWGNVDLITLEFSRIVLVVQCFAVGVELPRAYMEKHWRSVTLLLIPVMTFGWLITSLFIWMLFSSHLNWLDSLTIAACVTATDPVLASSVVGKGKFAKRVPKHLRDLLSAESGCNDGMAFPFVYLALYLIRYRPDAGKVAYHWICYTILYECLFGAVYGVIIGYAARRAVRYAHEKDLIDRESFLVFYFVLALWCAGSGALLGLDDLLVGFACGVGFSNDGWFLEKTEESHVSNVIDLLINLAFFVYFGSIIPWELFNQPTTLGTTPWRLVVLGLLVLFFRRIPIMLMLKPFIPDIKTWREALFAGHFGPIGVGGLFVAILARAELETDSTTPLAKPPEEGTEYLNIIELIWPITCFLVIVSIIVHGSSIAVFTLGKRINTLTISLSYTQANEDGPGWMDRLPRIQSRSKSQMSGRRFSESSLDEKSETTGPGLLPPTGYPKNFLRRQKEEEKPEGVGTLVWVLVDPSLNPLSIPTGVTRRRERLVPQMRQMLMMTQWRLRAVAPQMEKTR